MKVMVCGLGYVGTVTAALLAEHGHTVVGVDTNLLKVEMIRNGVSPVVEPGLTERVANAVRCGRLFTTVDSAKVQDCNVVLVCVGTPSGPGGQLDSSALRAVLIQLGQQNRQRADYTAIAIRSTVLPHILSEVVIPTLTEAWGTPPGARYGLAVTPEFLREGSSVEDFLNPPFTLIGSTDSRAGDVIEELFQFIKAPVLRMGLGEATMVKYASNAFHGLKVAFANEIGLICARESIDAGAVMRAFCDDTKLNISAKYLRPGFAFGGSCLPKDLRALTRHTRQLDIEAPLLNNILPSNQSYLEHCIDRVLATKAQRIGILGLSFKAGTDDLRESPIMLLAETLLGKGKQLFLYDRHVSLSFVMGANREFIERVIPHIALLIRDTIDDVVRSSEVVVIGNPDPEFDNLDIGAEQVLIEFGGDIRSNCNHKPMELPCNHYPGSSVLGG